MLLLGQDTAGHTCDSCGFGPVEYMEIPSWLVTIEVQHNSQSKLLPHLFCQATMQCRPQERDVNNGLLSADMCWLSLTECGAEQNKLWSVGVRQWTQSHAA